MCGCCVSECNSMEADPDFLGPAALAKGMRFVGDARDRTKVERLQAYSGEHGIWDCTRCYFCQERCPKGVDPRDAIAKLGAEAMKEGIDSDMGARHAKWFVTSAKTTGWLRETELVPKTQGIAKSVKEMKFAMGLAKKGKVPPPVPPHVAKHVEESRALYDLVKHEGGRGGASGHRPGGARPRAARVRRRGAASATRTARDRSRSRSRSDRVRRSRSEDRRVLQGLPGLALREGARHLHAGARPEGRPRARRARVGDVLRRGRHPRGRAGLLPAPERAHPRLRGGDRLRHAHDRLQRLHAQPAPGEPRAQGRLGPARAREHEPRHRGRARVLGRRRRRALPLARLGRRRVRAAEGRRAQGSQGPEDRAVLRLPDPASLEAPRVRGPGQARVARADHRGVRRRGRSTTRRRSSAAASRSSRRARTSRSPSSSSRSSRRRRPARTRW